VKIAVQQARESEGPKFWADYDRLAQAVREQGFTDETPVARGSSGRSDMYRIDRPLGVCYHQHTDLHSPRCCDTAMLRVFVSSTHDDLKRHRQVIRDAILKVGWHPDMMEDFGSGTGFTVEECLKKVRDADLVILLVAFKRGWVPRTDQGGRGGLSITALELEEARRLGKPVRILLSSASWPGEMWDHEPEAFQHVQRFREELNQIAERFGVEQTNPAGGEPIPGLVFSGKVTRLLLDHREALSRPAPAAGPAARIGLQPLLPSLWPALAGVLLPQQALTRAYQHFAPPGWPSLPPATDSPALLAWSVEQLGAAPRRHDDRVPLVDFLGALTTMLPADQAGPVRIWTAQALAHLGIDEATYRPADPAPLAAPVSQRVALLVQIEPSRFEAGHSRLKAWLSGTRQPPTLRSGDVSLSEAGLRDEVRGLCEEVERICPQCDELCVEFLVPNEMLGLDVEWWPVGADFMDDVPLGIKYRVVVRPLRRHQARKADVRQAWARRWAELEQRGGQRCEVAGCLPPQPPDLPAVRLDNPGGLQLFSLLQLAPSVVCAVAERCLMARAPREGDLLGPLLQAGMPATIWLRGGGEGLADLLARLRGTILGDLPGWVLRLRREAEGLGDPAHVGRRVSLLWDDARRISPEFDPAGSSPLTPPVRLPSS
jgi:hypothetical protein